jgi:hypothetical protein
VAPLPAAVSVAGVKPAAAGTSVALNTNELYISSNFAFFSFVSWTWIRAIVALTDHHQSSRRETFQIPVRLGRASRILLQYELADPPHSGKSTVLNCCRSKLAAAF